MATTRFSVYNINKLCARRCCIHQRRDCDFFLYYKISSLPTVATCINGETPVFGTYSIIKKLFSHCCCKSMARTRFSVFITEKLFAHCCCMQQWRQRDFRYMIWRNAVLTVTAYLCCDNTIFRIYHKETLCLPLLRDFRCILQRSPGLAVAACINGETKIFGRYKGAIIFPVCVCVCVGGGVNFEGEIEKSRFDKGGVKVWLK